LVGHVFCSVARNIDNKIMVVADGIMMRSTLFSVSGAQLFLPIVNVERLKGKPANCRLLYSN